MTELAALFPDSYEASRLRFRSQLERLRARWPETRLHTQPLEVDDQLTTDWFESPAGHSPERLLIVTTGEHGIEGYVGSAVLQVILEDYLDRLDPRSTGVLLVHAINPWGMRSRRRTNPANVDLNRNFVAAASHLDPALNPGYARLDRFLNPARPLADLVRAHLEFLAGLLAGLARMGPQAFQAVTLQGQYRNPRGLYFGGSAIQAETRLLIDLYREAPARYGQVLCLDIHTGYGPSDQMTLVNSSLEPRASIDLMRTFDYPRVAKATLAEFYPMRGDMIDLVYATFRDRFPGKPLFATAFEFGTLGDSLPARLRGLRAMIWENQIHHFAASSVAVQRAVRREFEAMFCPTHPQWRRKAIADARRALEGILRVEGFLPA